LYKPGVSGVNVYSPAAVALVAPVTEAPIETVNTADAVAATLTALAPAVARELARVVTPATGAVNEVLIGFCANEAVKVLVPAASPPVATAIVTGIVTVDPTTAEPSAGVIVPSAIVIAPAPAFAGTTDKSPNPSEATATADTFFNEIVFTIFLSFSQIKEFLLPGW
jgi:hypothetical protein